MEEHLSVLQQRQKKRKVKWPPPSDRSWLNWNGNLVQHSNIWNSSCSGQYILRVNKTTLQLKHLDPEHISGVYFCFRNSVSGSRAQSFPHLHKFFPTQEALEDQVAAITSKSSLFPPRAAVEGNIQVSKGHHELQKSSWHNACLPLSKSECKWVPKDSSHQSPPFGMSISAAIGYPDPWGDFSIWTLTVCAINNFPLHLWGLIKRGAGWK